MLLDLPLHPTPFEHWQAVGALRASLARKGVAISTPDAHVAVCAIEAACPLWSTDGVFALAARHTDLRVFAP